MLRRKTYQITTPLQQNQAEKLEESGKKATAVGKKVAADVAQSGGSSQAAQAAEQSSGSSSTDDVSANATEEGSTSVGKEDGAKMASWSVSVFST